MQKRRDWSYLKQRDWAAYWAMRGMEPRKGPRRVANRCRHVALDDVILDHVSTREWRSSSEIYDAVVDDYGTVDARAVYRHLKQLRTSGALLSMKCPEHNRRRLYRKPAARSQVCQSTELR